MKDSNSLIQGRLLPQYYDAFSRYLLKYVDAYAAEGVPIFALTVQNEPDYEPKDYPGMDPALAQPGSLVFRKTPEGGGSSSWREVAGPQASHTHSTSRPPATGARARAA